MSEYLVMPERNCIKIPDSMTMAQAAFAEPFSIAVYALKFLKQQRVQSTAILGSGPIGLCVLLEAMHRGITKNYITDKLDDRLSVAQRAGASWTGNPDKNDIIEEILRLEPLQLDAVFECCGDPAALDQAVELLKPGGILLVIGIPAELRLSLDMNKIRRKEITIQPVRRQNECLGEAVNRIASGQVDIDFMLTHSGALSQTKELYDIVADYRQGVIKATIDIS